MSEITVEGITTTLQRISKRIELKYKNKEITVYLTQSSEEFGQLDIDYEIDEDDAKTLTEEEKEEIMEFLNEELDDIGDF